MKWLENLGMKKIIYLSKGSKEIKKYLEELFEGKVFKYMKDFKKPCRRIQVS